MSTAIPAPRFNGAYHSMAYWGKPLRTTARVVDLVGSIRQ